MLGLIEAFLEQPVMEDHSKWTPEEGIPQGSTVGPLMANILCKTEREANAALARLREEMTGRGLTLHPDKTRVTTVHRRGGFDFLGYHFEQKGRRPRQKSLVKFKDRVRELTRRLDGNSLQTLIARLNATVRGWFEYFKHSSKRTFPPLDAWIRMRLRSIFIRRNKKRGVGRGLCHYTWTTDYFAKLGLFTMTTARASASRPLKRAH